MLKTNHVNNTHGEDTSCETCDLRFPSNKYLLTHIRKVHSNDHIEKVFSCSFCEKSFKSKQMLKLHELKSCKIKFNLTFTCEKCDKVCTGKAALMKHMEVHKEKIAFKKGNVKDECQVCFKLVLPANMKKHQDTHTKKVENTIGFSSFVKKQNKFSCEHCPLKFASNYSLKRHLMTIHKVDNVSNNDIVYYKNHFITRNKENLAQKMNYMKVDDIQLKDDEKKDSMEFDETPSQDEANFDSILDDIIGDVVNIIEKEAKSICEAILNDIIDE